MQIQLLVSGHTVLSESQSLYYVRAVIDLIALSWAVIGLTELRKSVTAIIWWWIRVFKLRFLWKKLSHSRHVPSMCPPCARRAPVARPPRARHAPATRPTVWSSAQSHGFILLSLLVTIAKSNVLVTSIHSMGKPNLAFIVLDAHCPSSYKPAIEPIQTQLTGWLREFHLITQVPLQW